MHTVFHITPLQLSSSARSTMKIGYRRLIAQEGRQIYFRHYPVVLSVSLRRSDSSEEKGSSCSNYNNLAAGCRCRKDNDCASGVCKNKRCKGKRYHR